MGISNWLPRYCGESADPLTVSDHLWLARWLLYRIGEDYEINARLHPKPVKGDWNGAGKHTNFSTKETRDPKKGMDAIHKAIKALEKNHAKHIKVYGADLELRLTGKHETAPMDKFSFRRGQPRRLRAHPPLSRHGWVRLL